MKRWIWVFIPIFRVVEEITVYFGDFVFWTWVRFVNFCLWRKWPHVWLLEISPPQRITFSRHFFLSQHVEHMLEACVSHYVHESAFSGCLVVWKNVLRLFALNSRHQWKFTFIVLTWHLWVYERKSLRLCDCMCGWSAQKHICFVILFLVYEWAFPQKVPAW